ncbi:MAG: class I SAM-dependent methyltransferase [Actinobacteria bacterium]|nr:class I SAM-dependent methyltransferase [Actinomycetota bacterium]
MSELESQHDFDNLADYYDAFLKIALFFAGGEKRLRRNIADFILRATDLGSKKIIVADVGCGTGSLIPFLPLNWDIYCIDKSKKMLDLAEKKNIGRKVTYIQKEVFSLENYFESFDLTISVLFLHEMDPERAWKALDKLINITKKSGFLVVIDFFGNFTTKWKIFSKILSLFEPKQNLRTMISVLPFIKKDSRIELIARRNFALGLLTGEIYIKK